MSLGFQTCLFKTNQNGTFTTCAVGAAILLATHSHASSEIAVSTYLPGKQATKPPLPQKWWIRRRLLFCACPLQFDTASISISAWPVGTVSRWCSTSTAPSTRPNRLPFMACCYHADPSTSRPRP